MCGDYEPPGKQRSAASHSGATRHHVHLSRLSPTIKPVSPRARVWCEIVGWLVPSGTSMGRANPAVALAGVGSGESGGVREAPAGP